MRRKSGQRAWSSEKACIKHGRTGPNFFFLDASRGLALALTHGHHAWTINGWWEPTVDRGWNLYEGGWVTASWALPREKSALLRPSRDSRKDGTIRGAMPER